MGQKFEGSCPKLANIFLTKSQLKCISSLVLTVNMLHVYLRKLYVVAVLELIKSQELDLLGYAFIPLDMHSQNPQQNFPLCFVPSDLLVIIT